MSIFTSICQDKEHNDKIDVAFSSLTNEVRLVIWEYKEQPERNVYLTLDETLHLIYLLSTTITKVVI